MITLKIPPHARKSFATLYFVNIIIQKLTIISKGSVATHFMCGMTVSALIDRFIANLLLSVPVYFDAVKANWLTFWTTLYPVADTEKCFGTAH